MKRIFVSYRHHQGDWVLNELCPALRAAKLEVLVDQERFTAGKCLLGQMDAIQDSADLHLLVLSPDYIESEYCMHELRRAVTQDPDFVKGKVIPLKREHCPLPTELRGSGLGAQPLYVDLQDPESAEQWNALLKACDGSLQCTVPHWQATRREAVRHLLQGESVNLVVAGYPAWRALVDQVREDLDRAAGPQRAFAAIDLEDPETASRRGLLQRILKELGHPSALPPATENEDLSRFAVAIQECAGPAHLALLHFDRATDDDRPYGIELFLALRSLVTKRSLRLLVQSRVPVPHLARQDHQLSPLETQLHVVELTGEQGA